MMSKVRNVSKEPGAVQFDVRQRHDRSARLAASDTLRMGPVGGGVRVPWRLARVGGARGLAYEALCAWRRAVARYLDPLVRLTWRRAELILVQNLDTLRWLPRRHRPKGLIWPNTGFDPADVVIRGRSQETRGEVVAVTPGRLLHLKAVPLALRAIACVPNGSLRLIVVGDGPERRRLTKLVHNVGIGKRVTFRGWLLRPELFQLFSEADLLLFPSLHDEGGLVVVEAMAPRFGANRPRCGWASRPCGECRNQSDAIDSGRDKRRACGSARPS
jgi:glycosyltransferase involved in cell wall biosynthesis